ncbi:MAG TPA: phosphoribosylformylglycinamidine synthase subunit PurS [Membranihabitans sp.]|nr:phosphoribosylformylglycinamidine synthase subunit PurS [Membranihabitans sp.]
MKFKAEIQVMPHAELLDPQGKTVGKNLPNIGIHQVEQVRIGKHIEMIVEAQSEEEAKNIVDTACKKLLANLIMETYEFKIYPLP